MLTENDIKQISQEVAKVVSAYQHQWLTPKELADQFGLPETIQVNLRRGGKIPHHKKGRYIRYKRSDINAWLQSSKVV